MKTTLRKKIILLILIVVFASPGIAAYIFYQHPYWLTAASTNHGTLLKPPQSLAVLDQSLKWRLILWHEGACADFCQQQLDKLARIRLALGRRLYDVDQYLLVPEDAMPISVALKQQLADYDIHTLSINQAQQQQVPALTANKTAVFIADPHNYLVLYYPLQSKSADIYADIKHLLGVTNQNG